MTQRLGVDTGGTFTDFVWLGADGRYQIHKQLSTPQDPSEAILSGMETMVVPETAAVDILQGKPISKTDDLTAELVRAYGPDGQFLGIVTGAGSQWRARKMFPAVP